MKAYGFSKDLRVPLGQALETILVGLEDNGLDVLAVIDVKKEFKETLDVDFKQYVILGACNSAGVQQALGSGEDLGWPRRCVVIIYEKDGKTVVSAIRPTAGMPKLDDLDLQEHERGACDPR